MRERTYIITALLVASVACHADLGQSSQMTVPEYRAELNQLLSATEQLDSSERDTPAILQQLPPSWRVHTEKQDFDISAEGLREDVRRFEREKSLANARAIQSRIQGLRDDLGGFESPPPDVASAREHLAALLARPEFRDVRGPTFIDRFKQAAVSFLLRALELLFRSSAIPTISRFLVYGLIGLAVLTLGFIAYRQIRASGEFERVVPSDLPVSAKDWSVWLGEARAAAAQDNWREAIHLAYWAGISFLEDQGAWRPDRARTPREYLRLLSTSSEHREALEGLTRVFELAWYAKRGADAAAFSETIQVLESLGCRQN